MHDFRPFLLGLADHAVILAYHPTPHGRSRLQLLCSLMHEGSSLRLVSLEGTRRFQRSRVNSRLWSVSRMPALLGGTKRRWCIANYPTCNYRFIQRISPRPPSFTKPPWLSQRSHQARPESGKRNIELAKSKDDMTTSERPLNFPSHRISHISREG